MKTIFVAEQSEVVRKFQWKISKFLIRVKNLNICTLFNFQLWFAYNFSPEALIFVQLILKYSSFVVLSIKSHTNKIGVVEGSKFWTQSVQPKYLYKKPIFLYTKNLNICTLLKSSPWKFKVKIFGIMPFLMHRTVC